MFRKEFKTIPEFPQNWRPKVLIANADFPQIGLDILRERCDLVIVKGWPKPTREEILNLIKGVDAVVWCNSEKLNAEVLDRAGPQLKVICTYYSGYDYIDVKEARKRGIILGYTGIASKDPVADVAVGLMITAGRRLYEGFLKIKCNEWEKRPQWLMGFNIAGSTVGIVGLGTIGQKIIQRLQGFEVGQFLYTGRMPKPEGEKLGAAFVHLDELLAKSDYVILSCPLTPETKFLINRDTLGKMKRTSVLVNVARGEIVNQEDLVEALKEKIILAAGLDVTWPEPLPSEHPLVNLDNCFISPHLGSCTAEVRNEMSTIVALNVLQGLAGMPLICPIP
ncbi:hypothetical protein DMENIID0001_084920 [Sergentomyia squamirostris]